MTIFKNFRTGFTFSSGSTTYFVDIKKESTKHILQLHDIEESFSLGVPLLETGYHGLHALHLLEFMLTSGVSVARKEKSSSAMRGRRESHVLRLVVPIFVSRLVHTFIFGTTHFHIWYARGYFKMRRTHLIRQIPSAVAWFFRRHRCHGAQD